MAYAKHQSFYLKQNWVNKGIKATQKSTMSLLGVDNYYELGIGKNMFLSLRYWLEATNIIKPTSEGHELTLFGKYISSNDLSCKKPFTVNLMQYFLSCDKPENGVEKSHTFYWFFNIFEERILKKQTLVEELLRWDTLTYRRSTSQNTIGRDIDCLLQTYTKSEKTHPEDKNISVLAQLGLVQKSGELLVRTTIRRNMIDLDAIYFIVLKIIEQNEGGNTEPEKYIDLDTLASADSSPCKIFGLTRIEFTDIIEEMSNRGYSVEIVRTNNLDTVHISDILTANKFLESKI